MSVDEMTGVQALEFPYSYGQPSVNSATKPDPMLNAHQEWIDGLADAAKKAKA